MTNATDRIEIAAKQLLDCACGRGKYGWGDTIDNIRDFAEGAVYSNQMLRHYGMTDDFAFIRANKDEIAIRAVEMLETRCAGGGGAAAHCTSRGLTRAVIAERVEGMTQTPNFILGEVTDHVDHVIAEVIVRPGTDWEWHAEYRLENHVYPPAYGASGNVYTVICAA